MAVVLPIWRARSVPLFLSLHTICIYADTCIRDVNTSFFYVRPTVSTSVEILVSTLIEYYEYYNPFSVCVTDTDTDHVFTIYSKHGQVFSDICN